MSVSAELMLGLERIEAAAWEDLAKAAPPPFASAIGLETARLGRTLFVGAARVPQFQFNWLAGAGLEGDDSAAITEAVQRFKATGQSKFFVQIPPCEHAANMERQAREAGLSSHPLAWAKFHRATAKAPRSDSRLTIREVERDERMVFAETAIAGFGMPAAMAQWLSEIVGRPHWHAYVSFDGDKPAGAGALYVDGDFAWFGIGATRPEMRKLGGQSALLARRIADALKFGARHAVTETGVPQPGAEAPSYKNILNAGFAVAYVRPNWALPA
jgi:hypothetical protein